ncbi:MAG: iron-siderophore ABC transporter substrate-binding protein [Chloroflexota bacterium]|nr:iron-siderophore ABC transporter substrate-binding protein [Chloroflexota bacterium]
MNTRSIIIFALLALFLASFGFVSADESEDAFPVTIEHKFGSTTITEEPQRIVSIGFTEQDPLLALGVTPVAVRYWYGDPENAIFPWAIDESGGVQPQALNMPYGNLNYEAILALAPDLISAVDSGITQEEYEFLSQIAPTLAQYDTYVDFGMPWQETTRLIGKALGRSEQAEAAIGAVESSLTQARNRYPQFQGATVSVAYKTAETYGYYTGQDGRGRFFTDLGFVVPAEQNELAGDSFYYYLSEERIDILDTDLLVFLALQFYEGGSDAAREVISADALLSKLDVVQDDRVFFVSDEYDDALQFSTVLSLQYLLENMAPEIARLIPLECDSGLRAVVDAVGVTVCVPDAPQRVVALQEGDIDGLLALDVEPIGATNGRGQMTPPRYLDERLPEDTVSVGAFFRPNLEVILSLQPDLILFAGYSNPDVLAQLNAIAPVYNTATFDEDWRAQFARVGEALNMGAEADAVLADYDQRVATLGANLGAAGDEMFIVGRWTAEGPQIMAPTTFSSRILIDVGLQPPLEIPELQQGHPHSAPLSLESVGIIDVDWAFLGTLQGQGDAVEALDELLENPLFQSLQVVQNDRVVVIDGSLWTSVGGPLAAMAVLDDVEASVLAGE